MISSLFRRNNVVFRSARILSVKDRKKVMLVILLQIAFGLLDLLGVGIVGVLGTVAISGVGAGNTGNRVKSFLSFIGIENQSVQVQAAVLGSAAAILLIGKTVFSIFFTRKTLFFLSRRGAEISSNLLSRLFTQSLIGLQNRSMNETLYSVTGGVQIIVIGVLGATVSLISDTSLLVVMAFGLFVVEPTVAFSIFLIFGIIGLLLYKLMHLKAKSLGLRSAEIGIRSNERILEVISAYRETVVKNRRFYYAKEIGKQRMELANITAEMNFMPNISKYIMEITVVLGSLFICAIQFLRQDAVHAVGVLSIFLAASSRIAPAILRIQQGAVSIRAALGSANPTLDLIESLKNLNPINPTNDSLQTIHKDFEPTIEVSNIEFSYPTGLKVVDDLSLSIQSGEIVAIVGESGAGKTTLVDLFLGVLEPDKGKISISGKNPLESISQWPGAISYVPQDVLIINGTFRENVSMGFPITDATDELVWSALDVAQLSQFVRSLPNSLDNYVGDRGTQISGGQRQRLGIARAMFTQPRLLVLDEATSSLDGETESNISDAIQGLKGSVTVLMIAHRLSTVRNADKVIYLRKGKIEAQGSFEEVRTSIPDFDRQAKLMGL